MALLHSVLVAESMPSCLLEVHSSWMRTYSVKCSVTGSSSRPTSNRDLQHNEALLLAAWGREAAGSLRSLAATIMKRRSRAPRR